jgi:hypothetical protein
VIVVLFKQYIALRIEYSIMFYTERHGAFGWPISTDSIA